MEVRRRRGRTAGRTRKVGEENGGVDAETEAGCWDEGSPQTVRGPKTNTQEEMYSVAAPGPGFEAALP